MRITESEEIEETKKRLQTPKKGRKSDETKRKEKLFTENYEDKQYGKLDPKYDPGIYATKDRNEYNQWILANNKRRTLNAIEKDAMVAKAFEAQKYKYGM